MMINFKYFDNKDIIEEFILKIYFVKIEYFYIKMFCINVRFIFSFLRIVVSL